jgi:gamma-glutamylcyclotransferase (GGCT)/AIG2-like uncharacterized protein YtfP
MPTLLFIYGTLRDRARLDTLLAPVARWRLVGSASVRGRLYDAGDYPALTLDGSPEDLVAGLLIEVEPEEAALARLDDYEGVAQGLYHRQRCVVLGADGDEIPTWVYVYARSAARLPRIARWPARD